MEQQEQKQQSLAILCGICTGQAGAYSTEETMEELGELARTAGAEVFATVLQNRDGPETATMLGRGKLEEIAGICRGNDVALLIFDDELSGTQIKNIEDITHVRVVDRTALILDIFAARAKSREGRLQVELAQLKYITPRLSGLRPDLSRLGGGIGTRGPGEKKLETDRRHIRRRILSLEHAIDEIGRRRGLLRVRRAKDGMPSVAIVGYTNAGKSTLLNALTGAGVTAENMLFATLDPTSRGLTLPDGREILLTDTVGFINKLPHHLVDAFRSTLEEAAQADLILNVCDASDPGAAAQLAVSETILESLGCAHKPTLLVLNKCDLPGSTFLPPRGREWVRVSAKTERGLPELINKLSSLLPLKRARIKLLLPYDRGGLCDQVRRFGVLRSQQYLPEGIAVEGEIDADKLYLVQDYLQKS